MNEKQITNYLFHMVLLPNPKELSVYFMYSNCTPHRYPGIAILKGNFLIYEKFNLLLFISYSSDSLPVNCMPFNFVRSIRSLIIVPA